MLPRLPAAPVRSAVRRLLPVGLVLAMAGTLLTLGLGTSAQAASAPQPGDFRGKGFDQCVAPGQRAMDKWLWHSPYQAVGIYISGDQRACREQPNLTPGWIDTQIRRGWKLLPITLGPQAYCNPRFPRYGKDDIHRTWANRFEAARHQGNQVGREAAAAARALGIPRGSTLWYDLEGYDTTNTTCRLSSMAFLHGWNNGVVGQRYVPGVYSSAATGMNAIFDEKNNPSSYNWRLPERVWIADWDGVVNVQSEFLDRTSWMPGDRVKQYRGGHPETWGGQTIDIDNNWLVMGAAWRPSVRYLPCGGVNVDFKDYRNLVRGTRYRDQVKALQCLLKYKGHYAGPLDSVYDGAVINAANRFLATVGRPQNASFSWGDWTALLAHGPHETLKPGSRDRAVRRLQRALNAAVRADLDINGKYDYPTKRAVREYQAMTGMSVTGYAVPTIWPRLIRGER